MEFFSDLLRDNNTEGSLQWSSKSANLMNLGSFREDRLSSVGEGDQILGIFTRPKDFVELRSLW